MIVLESKICNLWALTLERFITAGVNFCHVWNPDCVKMFKSKFLYVVSIHLKCTKHTWFLNGNSQLNTCKYLDRESRSRVSAVINYRNTNICERAVTGVKIYLKWNLCMNSASYGVPVVSCTSQTAILASVVMFDKHAESWHLNLPYTSELNFHTYSCSFLSISSSDILLAIALCCCLISWNPLTICSWDGVFLLPAFPLLELVEAILKSMEGSMAIFNLL